MVLPILVFVANRKFECWMSAYVFKPLDTRVLSAKIDSKPPYIDYQIKKPFIG